MWQLSTNRFQLDSAIIKYLKNHFSFWSWTGAFLLSIMDVNIAFCRKLVCLLKFYVTLIQLIVLNVKSKCNIASDRNVVNHSQPYFRGP